MGTNRKNETIYIVKAEEMNGAKETAYEILRRLIMKTAIREMEENLTARNERTCCLGTNGGKEKC